MKKVLVVILALAMVFTMFACGGKEQGEQGSSEYTLTKNIYSLGSGTSGSVFITYMNALGDLFTKNVPGMNISVEPGSSSGNQIALHKREIDFGIISSLQVYAGMVGTDWAQGQIYNDLYGFIPAYSYEGLFISKKDSGITCLSDLEGKVVAVGAAGSGSDTTGRQVIEYFGITPKNLVNGSWTDLGGQLQDGMIDAIFYLAGHPASFITELEVQTELNIFSLSDEEFTKWVGANSYYAVGTIPAGTYKAITSDVKVLQGWNFIGISKDIDDDLAYYLTKTVWDNIDVIRNASASFKQTALENVQYMVLKAHPGSEKYYKEVGATLPTTVLN